MSSTHAHVCLFTTEMEIRNAKCKQLVSKSSKIPCYRRRRENLANRDAFYILGILRIPTDTRRVASV